ncbi:MAG TPA: Flp pilus assembly protein CpaB [Geminicoccaceae bacterium]|nr:Flp pilus assembly protein CpaB [Geminicoccaceae bacterium]
MGPRRLLVLLVALAAAGGTALFARSWVEGQRVTNAAQPPTVAATEERFQEVLVAGEDLPVGAFIKPGAVRWQRWPTGELPGTYFVRDRSGVDAVVGAVVRRGIAKGEPLTEGGVVKPGDRGFLAAVLEPGMRAVSVPIDDTSGNAGLIFPGDRVDLILTQVLADDGGGPKRLASETALESLRILAMGRRTTDDSSVSTDGRSRTATLEVTPGQAEAVALLTDLGKLSLSLRSLAQPEGAAAAALERPEAERMTWDWDASRARRAEGSVRQRVVVVRGQDKSEVDVPGYQP